MLACISGGLPAAAGDTSYLRVDHQDSKGVTLSVRVPKSSVESSETAEGRRQIALPGVSREARPGRPELPVLITTVAIPEGARLQLDWTAAEALRLPGAPLRVAPVLPAPDREPRELSHALSRSIHGSQEAWPAEPVIVDEVQFRSVRLARLSIYPLQYHAASREVLLLPELQIRLRFVGGKGFTRPASPTKPSSSTAMSAFEQRLLNSVANRTTVQAAPSVRSAKPGAAPAQKRGVVPSPGVKIRVDSAGLVRLARAQLNAAGFDTTGDPRKLQMSYRGTTIPCRVVGEDDGEFDAGDYLEFYGTPGTGRFSEDNIYWLQSTLDDGLRFATRDATPGGAAVATTFPSTRRFEESNSVYDFGEGTEEGDPRFYWAWFDSSNPNPPRISKLTHVAALPDVDPTGPQATFRALFKGRTDPLDDPDHLVAFKVNGTEIGQASWNGMGLHLAEIDFDPSLLDGGNNTFEIELQQIAIIDSYYMDWFEIDYPRTPTAAGGRVTIVGEGDAATRYDVDGFGGVSDPVVLDIADPLAPVALTGVGTGGDTLSFEDLPTGRAYLVVGDSGRIAATELVVDVPSNLRDTANGADLIIVTPDGWESALAPLVAHRQAQGLRVVLANLTDVADEFAGGNVDDLAIRDLTRHAYENWQPPAVSYLLLVGEPNLDPLNYLERASFDHWMPTHFGVTEALGETMSDNWLGSVAGDDLLPDVGVGRLSVRDPAAAEDVVAKIIGYENAATDGAAWRSNVVRVASTSPLFEEALEQATALLPDHFTLESMYRLDGATTVSIRSAVDSGAAMVSFLGHGNVASWADVPGGSFFETGDAEDLTNTGRLPFVTALNCLNGLVGHPTLRDSLAEVFVNDPTQGAIAALSPSGLGFLSEFTALQTTMYETIYQTRVPTIGAATMESLVRTFLEHPVDLDLITKLILTGDPSNFLAIDTDDDGVLDYHELSVGLNPGDQDSDDDGLGDGDEDDGSGPGADTDGDGVIDALDPDADNDGLWDGLEAGIAVPGPDTDLSRGVFRADTNPATTTNPLKADTDDGGAPDGIEDLNADGGFDFGETDPRIRVDDPSCSTATPPELATSAGDLLTLSRSGEDVQLNWGAGSEACILYRLYRAANSNGSDGAGAFEMRAVTGQPTFVDSQQAAVGTLQLYLVVGSTLEGGEGPWGHFDQ